MNLGNLFAGRRSGGGGCAGIVIGPIFILIGVGIFYFLGGSFREAYASRSWPTAQGQITQSEMTEHHDSDGTMYGTDIAYDYSVDGQKYTSYRVTLMDGTTSVRQSVRNTLNHYPVGGTVTVYYDPGEPVNAVLEPGFTGGVLMLGAFIVCFPAAGLLAFFGSIWQLLRLRFWG